MAKISKHGGPTNNAVQHVLIRRAELGGNPPLVRGGNSIRSSQSELKKSDEETPSLPLPAQTTESPLDKELTEPSVVPSMDGNTPETPKPRSAKARKGAKATPVKAAPKKPEPRSSVRSLNDDDEDDW